MPAPPRYQMQQTLKRYIPSIYESICHKCLLHPERDATPLNRSITSQAYLILNCSILEFAISCPSALNAVTFHLSGLPETMLAFISGVIGRKFCDDLALARAIPATSFKSPL